MSLVPANVIYLVKREAKREIHISIWFTNYDLFYSLQEIFWRHLLKLSVGYRIMFITKLTERDTEQAQPRFEIKVWLFILNSSTFKGLFWLNLSTGIRTWIPLKFFSTSLMSWSSFRNGSNASSMESWNKIAMLRVRVAQWSRSSFLLSSPGSILSVSRKIYYLDVAEAN